MELIKIINARKILSDFSDREDIGAHLSYWMTKFIAKTENEQSFFGTEMQKLIDKYAEKGEDNAMVIPTDKISEFNAEVEKLNSTDVEDPGIRFNLSEIASELTMSMRQMYPLLDFINEDK